jgi:hypothetical protein
MEDIRGRYSFNFKLNKTNILINSGNSVESTKAKKKKKIQSSVHWPQGIASHCTKE